MTSKSRNSSIIRFVRYVVHPLSGESVSSTPIQMFIHPLTSIEKSIGLTVCVRYPRDMMSAHGA